MFLGGDLAKTAEELQREYERDFQARGKGKGLGPGKCTADLILWNEKGHLSTSDNWKFLRAVGCPINDSSPIGVQ